MCEVEPFGIFSIADKIHPLLAVSYFFGMIYTAILIITLISDSTGQTIYKDNGDDKPINGLQFNIDIFHCK